MKIGITGPESSGKTTLAIELAAHFGTFYIPEFARFDLQDGDGSYHLDDLRRYLESLRETPNDELHFYDSEHLVLQVWQEVRFGSCMIDIQKQRSEANFDYYLLCSPDIPWSYDPLREDKDGRDALFARYRGILEQANLPYSVISGNQEERLQKAIKEIVGLKKKG